MQNNTTIKPLNQNKMKQTAVEWLAEQITTVKWKMSDVTDRNSIIEQAKAMEREQIENAFNYGQIDLGMEADEYYNQTFKSE